MVVEDFASAFLAQRGLSYWLIVYGLIVAGGLVGWMWSALTGRRARLGQAPFFVRLCLATLFLCVAEMASFKSPEAMAWMVETRLAAWLVASSLIGGVYIGRIAAARSLDAFGNMNGTPLVFIPVVNPLLALMASAEARPGRRFGLMHGEEGAIFGVILLVLAGGGLWLASIPSGDLSDVLALMEARNATETRKSIREEGLRKTLEWPVEAARRSPDYDDTYSYVATEIDRETITFTLRALKPGWAADASLLRERRETLCDDSVDAELLKAGATYRTVFLDSDGREQATETTTAGDCTFPPSLRPWWAAAPSEIRLPDALGLDGDTPREKALSFLILSDSRISLVGLALTLLGGLGAALVRSTGKVGRASYFLGNCLLVLAAVGSRALLIPTPVALVGERLAAMAALWALAQVALGVVLWRLAARRSRDVHGHAWAAPLAFIPLANLWLLIAPSPGVKAPDGIVIRPACSQRQAASVLAGLALLGGSYWVEGEIEQATSRALLRDEAPPELWIRLAINNDGIENVLKGLAGAKNPDPLPGEAFTLTQMRADGLHLYETWTVHEAGGRFSPRQQAQFKDYHCSIVDDVSLMKAGAILHHAYVAPSGRTLGTIRVSKDICGL